jgi:hypothetical protein
MFSLYAALDNAGAGALLHSSDVVIGGARYLCTKVQVFCAAPAASGVSRIHVWAAKSGRIDQPGITSV